MLTQTCKLTLPNGATLTAKVVADSPESEPTVDYDIQPADEFADLHLFETAAPAFLKAWFENLSVICGGKLTVETSGQYDTWAE
jgi:hypothetical protein